MNTFRQTFILVALTVVLTGLIVSACAFWGTQSPSETEMEATLVVLVDIRLTEAASAAPVAGGVQTPAPPDSAARTPITGTPGSGSLLLTTPPPDRSGELMQVVIANTRHFTGSPDAPVTIVEFSDFQ
ncbi:MAG: hypothetical protein DCC55_39140 [Chloroflexi bacterium]|nr:MAG: hypothetical protein DCC55_39140 [Chloroflexota bacterium]